MAATNLSDTSVPARRAGLRVITVAAFFMSADITMINVALPAIAADLTATVAALQWVVDAYNIVLAGLVLLGAGLGRRFGDTRVFLTGVATFAAGSLVAGLAGSLASLILGRIIMGVGGALLLAPALALIARLFPPEARGQAIAAWAAGGALGMGAGPLVGGLLLHGFGWQAVFLMNVPIMLATIVVGWRVLPASARARRAPLDLAGAALSVVGFAVFLGALIEGPRWGWQQPAIWAAALAGAGAIAGFVHWERRCQDPMFDVRILGRPGVLAASLALLGSYITYTGVLFLLAQQLHVMAGFDSIAMGGALAGFALVFWMGSRRAARLADDWGEVRVLGAGMLLMALGYGVLAVAAWGGWPALATSLALGGSLVAAAGVGLVVPRASVVILNGVPESLAAAASAASMLARLVGASVGIAVLGTALAMGLPAGPAHANPALFGPALAGAYGVGVMMMLGLLLAMWRCWRLPAASSQ